jgi:hypothetical protein
VIRRAGAARITGTRQAERQDAQRVGHGTMVSLILLSLYAIGNAVALALFGAIVISVKPSDPGRHRRR